MRATGIANTDHEPSRKFFRSNFFHHFANGIARPDPSFFISGRGQELTDVLIANLGTSIFGAKTSHFLDPGQKFIYVDLSLFICARKPMELAKKAVGCVSQVFPLLGVFNLPL